MKKEKSKYQVPNLERALKIMEFLSESPKNVTMAEIARQLGYPNNSVFRIVSTLEAEGYLIRNEDSKEFCLSRKLLSLGYKALVETNIVELSADILRMLRDDTRETALLGTILEGEGVVLNQEYSPEPIKFMVSPGTRFLLHSAAPGKAILAYLDKAECERQISLIRFTRFNSRTICSPDEYRLELEKVRENGYAVDRGEELEGVNCVAAPVFDYRGMPKAAIWVTGPEYRLPKDKIPQVGQVVKKHAKTLSTRLGFSNF
jgi:DNA-binding IclR family transcriptional regulator